MQRTISYMDWLYFMLQRSFDIVLNLYDAHEYHDQHQQQFGEIYRFTHHLHTHNKHAHKTHTHVWNIYYKQKSIHWMFAVLYTNL